MTKSIDDPINDPWSHLRRHTPSRIALGRAGAALPTRELLAFSADHAAARDAVRAELDVDALLADLKGLEVLTLSSAAATREEYLHHPELGRRLAEGTTLPKTTADISITLADGLSAVAAQLHAAPLLRALLPKLSNFSLAPLTIVRQARVAIQDDIGSRLGVKLSLILLGERPGLSSADSLGAYLVFRPGPHNSDANRNCVSNIRPAGFPLEPAAETIAHLIRESLSRKLSGVALKDERPTAISPSQATKQNPRLSGG